MPGTSCIDAMSPAFELVKKRLFRPFCFPFWLRICVLGLLTGEVAGGGGGFNFNVPFGGTQPSHTHDSFINPGMSFLAIIPFLVICAVLGFGLMLLLMYINSRLRFVLFDAVLHGRAEIIDGWRRWKSQGRAYFIFQLQIFLAFIGGVLVLAGGCVGALALAGNLRHPSIGAILLIVAVVLVLLVYALMLHVINVLVKDFVVPQMALENRTVAEGWRTLFSMMCAEKGSFTGYVLFKALLTICGSIMLGIALLIVLIVPILIVAVVVIVMVKGGAVWSFATIALAVSAAIVFIALITFLFGFLGAPLTVFFPAYSMHYFAWRYGPLYAELFPPLPPAPPMDPNPLPEMPIA